MSTLQSDGDAGQCRVCCVWPQRREVLRLLQGCLHQGVVKTERLAHHRSAWAQQQPWSECAAMHAAGPPHALSSNAAHELARHMQMPGTWGSGSIPMSLQTLTPLATSMLPM